MFETFRRNFSVDPGRRPGTVNLASDIPGLNELLADFGGASFNHGLYRIVSAQDVGAWNARVGLAFSEFAGRITCFGYDWLGRTFAVDKGRIEEGEPGILMFEPGTGEALEIPANIKTFHDVELKENPDAALASSVYAEWRETGGGEPAYDQCVGYKIPLFLNGKDEFENLELSDLEVYWHIMGQLVAKAKGLPPRNSC